jgi:hypothetical protein
VKLTRLLYRSVESAKKAQINVMMSKIKMLNLLRPKKLLICYGPMKKYSQTIQSWLYFPPGI